MLHCVGAIDADMRRTVHFSWIELVEHLSLLKADGEAKALGCIREVVEDVLQSFLHVGEKGGVISKQELSNEFPKIFVDTEGCACCHLFRNGCQCRLAGPLLPHRAC